MKKVVLGVITLLLALSFGIYFTKIIKAYFLFSDLRNKVRVTWSGDNGSFCGHPYGNPLCNYSPELKEIPTIEISELIQNPSFYHEKIIRVQGEFYKNNEEPFKSRLYMKSDDGVQHIGTEYWNLRVRDELFDFIELNAPNSNSANVSLIIQVEDLSNSPCNVEFNDNSPLSMNILFVEKMKPALKTFGRKSKKSTKLKSENCQNKKISFGYTH